MNHAGLTVERAVHLLSTGLCYIHASHHWHNTEQDERADVEQQVTPG